LSRDRSLFDKPKFDSNATHEGSIKIFYFV
jgi:hypothetical protein